MVRNWDTVRAILLKLEAAEAAHTMLTLDQVDGIDPQCPVRMSGKRVRDESAPFFENYGHPFEVNELLAAGIAPVFSRMSRNLLNG